MTLWEEITKELDKQIEDLKRTDYLLGSRIIWFLCRKNKNKL